MGLSSHQQQEQLGLEAMATMRGMLAVSPCRAGKELDCGRPEQGTSSYLHNGCYCQVGCLLDVPLLGTREGVRYGRGAVCCAQHHFVSWGVALYRCAQWQP